MESQEKRILDYLKTGAVITSFEALQKFACFRLASRIASLKKTGYAIRSEMIATPSGKHVARYWLEPQQLKLAW